MLAEQATKNAAQVEAAYGGSPANEGSTPVQDSEEDVIQEEYENEEQVAIVTVVEDLDIDALIHTGHPSERANQGSSSNQDQNQTGRPERRRAKGTKSTTDNTSGTSKKRATSAKKIKYETKAARSAEKRKQQARKYEKAARAGGKQSRSSKKRK